jgi:hypothetical protein
LIGALDERFHNIQAISFVGRLSFADWRSGFDLYHCRADGQLCLGTAVSIGASFGWSWADCAGEEQI